MTIFFTMLHPLCIMTRGDFLVAARIKSRAFIKKHKRALCVGLCLLFIILAVRGFENKISVFSKNYFPSFARQTVTKAVCSAVDEVLSAGNWSYGDFAEVKFSGGRVNAVETNSTNINTLKSRVIAAAEREAEKIHNSVMYIPLGAFTGLSLISNYGPKIPLSYCLTGSFSAELVSSFESAGNNQTIHHIRLIVTAEVVTASVDYDGTLAFTTDFEVAQSVLVGEIPTTYGGFYANPH